jgi:L-aspartate oxidase
VFLISEAVRGEGGVLRNTNGEAFMERYHELKDLAPRDVVARAIVSEMKGTESDHVLLDVTHIEASRLRARFPQIYKYCLDHGLDITGAPIPVSPAAHYMMGGVRTNTWGETTLPGLYACGECADTGVHGANRLASNSLLETVVFARRAVERTLSEPGGQEATSRSAVTLPHMQGHAERPLSLEALQWLMWQDVGIVRSAESLKEARGTLAAWERQVKPVARPSYELANLVLAARLTSEAALMRTESRGGHYRSDFPERKEEWRRRIVFRAAA